MSDLAPQICALLAQGIGRRKIAEQLGCSERDVRKHMTPSATPGHATAQFPVHPAVEAAKLEVLAAFCGRGDMGPAREKLRQALEQHHPRELRHPDQLEPTTLRDAFERRRLVRNKFLGPVSINAWGLGFENYCNLTSDGWDVSILLNDKVQKGWWGADPDKGEVYFPGATLNGIVEVRMERGK